VGTPILNAGQPRPPVDRGFHRSGLPSFQSAPAPFSPCGIEPHHVGLNVAPRVREAMTRYAAFEDIGKRMLLAWSEGVTGLHGKRGVPLKAFPIRPRIRMRRQALAAPKD
jgi:hypothetical protein